MPPATLQSYQNTRDGDQNSSESHENAPPCLEHEQTGLSTGTHEGDDEHDAFLECPSPEAAETPEAHGDETTKGDSGNVGELCELHVFEQRHNHSGVPVNLEVGAMENLPLDARPNAYAALVLRRYYDRDSTLQQTCLEIRSRYMKDALRTVMKSYPGVNLNSTGHIQLGGSRPHCVFHYRDELQLYAETSDNEDVKEHVEFLLNYMRRSMPMSFNNWAVLVEYNTVAPGLGFEDLWMAFRPGDLMIYKRPDTHGIHMITRLISFRKAASETDDEAMDHWLVTFELIETNGSVVSYINLVIRIWNYEGYRALKDCIIYPLQYHDDEEQFRIQAIRRGKDWLSLLGIHNRSYEGMALVERSDIPGGAYEGWKRVHGRIITDPKEYTTNVRPGEIRFALGPALAEVSNMDANSFSSEELMLCSGRVYAFSLQLKRWGVFHVDFISPIEYNKTAFDNLVIPQTQKTLIRSVVNDHRQNLSKFDDLIKGKGKGLIFLLHGPPGVGKTLTAESLADVTERPLYVLSCGDLINDSSTVEVTLSRALRLAYRWNALVLIDEADVFMEQRSIHDLSRNELVSILLRVLEYFEGVMLLTTNRIESIDDAFKSRIHLSLNYPNLSFEARKSIWKTFVSRGSKTDLELPEWLDDDILDRLSAYEINGRQIKNTIRMACSIAANEQRELNSEDILAGLEAWTSFETDFGNVRRSRTLIMSRALRRFNQRLRRYTWNKVTSVLRFSASLPRRLLRNRPLRDFQESRRATSRGRP